MIDGSTTGSLPGVTGVGVDVVDITRLEKAIERWGAQFTEKVFTGGELRYAGRHRRPSQHLSARFAAKEAVIKAVGRGFRGGGQMREVEIVTGPFGRPLVKLHGSVKQLAAERGVEKILISMSHAGNTALAQAVTLGRAVDEEDINAIS